MQIQVNSTKYPSCFPEINISGRNDSPLKSDRNDPALKLGRNDPSQLGCKDSPRKSGRNDLTEREKDQNDPDLLGKTE